MGYTNGDLWNGWATPYFPLEEAQKLQAEINQCEGMRMFYESRADKFYWQHEDEDEPYIWQGEDIQTVDGIKHLYGIGAYSHIWDELGIEDKRYLAYQINEFICDFDQYEYYDAFDDEEEAFEAILSNFADIEIFAEAHKTMNNATLSSDQIYSRLSEILDI